MFYPDIPILRAVVEAALDPAGVKLDEWDIDRIDKGDFYLLRYQPTGRNEYARMARGLILRKPTGPVADPLSLIVSLPFTRFFNRHEPESPTVDVANCDVV